VFADFINDSIRNSVIIPADLTIRLLRKRLQEAEKQNNRIILVDGFPRSLDQARAFEEEVIMSCPCDL
jgi:UMP-CMP kinase